MHKVFNIKWLYVMGAALLIAFSVTLIPSFSTFIHNFETIAAIMSIALYAVMAIFLALIVFFTVAKLCQACKAHK